MTALKLMLLLTMLFVGIIIQVQADPEAAPDPSPVADPGRKPKQSAIKPVLIEEPTDLIALRSSSTRLYCRAEGYPTPTISWLKDGNVLRNGANRIMAPTGELVFYHLRNLDSEGVYQCIARNSAGEARSRNATLRIAYIKENFPVMPKDSFAAVGGESIIKCKGPKGIPEPKISWMKDNRKISTNNGRMTIDDGNLVINGVQNSDAGSYECIAENMAGKRKSIPILLAVFVETEFVVKPQDTKVATGEDVELECEARGEPKPRIKWTKKTGIFPNSRVVSGSNGNLRITNVQPDDEGEYVCTAYHVGLEDKSASAKLTVTTKPEFLRRPHDVSVRVGSTVTLPCSATGEPKPSVLWHNKDDRNMFHNNSYKNGHFVVSADGDLTINEVRFEDAGSWTCQAFSNAGQNTAYAELRVLSRQSNINPPVIRQGPSNMTVAQGTTAELNCVTSATRVPKLTWKKDGSEVSDTGRKFTVTTSGSLIITNVQNSDGGQYTCTATNDYGWSNWDAWITVVAKGSPVVPPTGDVTKVPNAPGAPTRTDSTATGIALQWNPEQTNSGLQITGYILEYYCSDASEASTWMKIDQIVPSNSFTVTGLKSASSYVFLIRAVNSYGISDPSDVSEAIKTLGENPTEISELQKKIDQISVKVTKSNPLSLSTSSDGIRLEWESSAICDIIDGFKVFAQAVSVRNGAKIVETVPCFARKTELKNLQSRVVYEIRIRPYESDVIGHPSPIILASPESEGTAPDVPVLKIDLTTPEGDRPASGTFTWTPPASILPEYISQYTLRCHDKSNSHDSYDITKNVNSSVTTLTLNDLPRGRDFTAYVMFTTSLGEGMMSEKEEFSVEAAAVGDGDGLSSLMKNPGVLAGIAACAVLIIGIIVGVLVYRRYKRNQKSRGLHVRSFSFTPQSGGRPGIPMDPFETQYSKGFTMSLTNPGGNDYEKDGSGSGTGNMYLQHNNVHGGMAGPPPVTRNTIASLNNSNGNIGTSLSPDMIGMRPNQQTSSFSYVQDQLTSMSSIPPQFASPNSLRTPTQVMSTSDLHLHPQQYHRQISENPTLLADEQESLIDMNTPTEGYALDEDLPPPPPSPPMSLKTSLSDRTNRSRGSSKHSTDRGSNHSSRSRRSRERNRFQAMERVPTDTDTGIDSPQQTPSPPRPADLRGEHSQSNMTSQPRNHAEYPYHGQKQHNARRRNDGIALRIGDPNHGYLAGPSEGDTESELDGMRQHPRNYILKPEEVRNSVTVSSVSMMNAYDSESDCGSSNGMGSRTSSVESLTMESASQVGVNAPQQHVVAPRPGHSAFVPIQGGQYNGSPARPNFVKPKGQRKHHYNNNGDHAPGINGHNAHLMAPEQFLNRVNSASSSTSSSYHQNTADSGMSAGVGSYGHNSLNSSSSAESDPKGQMSRSRTTGSLTADHPPVENLPPHFASVDRRYIQDNSEYQQPRGRQPAPPPRRAPRSVPGYKSSSKSPQRKNSQDSNLSLPHRDGTTYADYETNGVVDDRQPMIPDNEYITNEDDIIETEEESRVAFLAAKSVFAGAGGAKAPRGRHPELSDVPEVSTSDFCEEYSDQSQ